jgi:hypothetical protein
MGLLVTAVGLFVSYTPWLLIIALIFTLIILTGVMGTRVEAAPPPSSSAPSVLE